MLNPDYREMLQYLGEEKVEFLVVGAHAMAVHGYARSTGDFDIWVNPESSNAVRLFRALARFGAPMQDLVPEVFTSEGVVFQIGVAPCRVDILTSITGHIAFSDALGNAMTVDLDGMSVPVLSLADLVRNKRATGRAKDLEDAELLEELAKGA